LSWIPLTML